MGNEFTLPETEEYYAVTYQYNPDTEEMLYKIDGYSDGFMKSLNLPSLKQNEWYAWMFYALTTFNKGGEDCHTMERNFAAEVINHSDQGENDV